MDEMTRLDRFLQGAMMLCFITVFAVIPGLVVISCIALLLSLAAG